MTLTYKDVATILALVRESEHCRTLELEANGIRVSLERHDRSRRETGSRPDSAPPADTATSPSDGATKIATEQAVPGRTGIVKAPLLGTFYRAPKADAPPFVEIGSLVRAGDTLGLIEVMKLFTEVTAPAPGTIAEIYARNAELVEFGQPLFRIDPES